jgi:hypothetical protein
MCIFEQSILKILTLIVKVTKPIVNLMRLVDFGKPITRKFYEYYDPSMKWMD